MEEKQKKPKKIKNNASKLIRLPKKILTEVKLLSKKLRISSSRFMREAIIEAIRSYTEDERE